MCVQEMTQAQMVLEKITLQKCLLYFESLHGRPVSPPPHTPLVSNAMFLFSNSTRGAY